MILLKAVARGGLESSQGVYQGLKSSTRLPSQHFYCSRVHDSGYTRKLTCLRTLTRSQGHTLPLRCFTRTSKIRTGLCRRPYRVPAPVCPTQIDLLVFYTPDAMSLVAASTAAQMESIIAAAFASTNEAMANSAISVDINVVHVQPVSAGAFVTVLVPDFARC